MSKWKLKEVAWLVPFVFVLLANEPVTKDQVYVAGTVLSESTGKPVANAHVYIVHGEEEGLTNTRGEFRILTAQKFPLTLTVRHTDYEKTSLVIANALQKQVVRLQSRPQQ